MGRSAGALMAVAGATMAALMLGLMGLLNGLGESVEGVTMFAAIATCVLGLGWSLGGVYGVQIARGANPWLCGLLLAFATVVGTMIITPIVIGPLVGKPDALLAIPWLIYFVLLFGGSR